MKSFQPSLIKIPGYIADFIGHYQVVHPLNKATCRQNQRQKKLSVFCWGLFLPCGWFLSEQQFHFTCLHWVSRNSRNENSEFLELFWSWVFWGSGYCCLKRSGVVGHRWGEVPICRMNLVKWNHGTKWRWSLEDGIMVVEDERFWHAEHM